MIRAALLLLLSLASLAFADDGRSMSLDGRWEFRFAPDDRGTSERWFADGTAFDRVLDVPGCWDAQGVGEPTDKMRHNAIGVGWYRRSFDVPADWRERGRHTWLDLGGVHRSARTCVNGRLVCDHIGYPLAAHVDITDALTTQAKQALVIAVDSRPDATRDPLV